MRHAPQTYQNPSARATNGPFASIGTRRAVGQIGSILAPRIHNPWVNSRHPNPAIQKIPIAGIRNMHMLRLTSPHAEGTVGASRHPVFPALSAQKEGEDRSKARANHAARTRTCVYCLRRRVCCLRCELKEPCRRLHSVNCERSTNAAAERSWIATVPRAAVTVWKEQKEARQSRRAGFLREEAP
jgi:hypothetical protein